MIGQPDGRFNTFVFHAGIPQLGQNVFSARQGSGGLPKPATMAELRIRSTGGTESCSRKGAAAGDFRRSEYGGFG